MAFVRTLPRIGRRLVRWNSTDRSGELRLQLLTNEYEGIAVFRMNRPETRNAMSKNFMKLFEEHIDFVKHNKSVRTVIVKSDVPGAFCSGADLKERRTMAEEDVPMFVSKARALITEMSELPMPVIAALDGVALGGGMEIALACDIRVAADNAKMGLVETRLAIIPGAGGTQRLPRLVGIGKAKELVFTAKILDGVEAADIGLVEQAVTQNENGDAAYLKARELAKEICSKGPVAIRAAKQAITYGMQTDIATGMKVEESSYSSVIPTEDRLEALKAFAEKRTPVYKGK